MKILEFPNSKLRQVSEPVKEFNHELVELVDALESTRKSRKHGIGIAAPQIGVLKRVAIVDVSERVPGACRQVLVNPVIVTQKNKVASREGCMSIPEYTGQLLRYDWIKLEWRDVKGEMQSGEFTGIEARCIQHELDHLNGKLFIDRVNSMKKDMMPRRRRHE